MTSFTLIALFSILLILYGLVEYQLHQRYLKAIPHRIHINGTRGKSSVTRLIGAGLRAGGLRTITKVTGTFPRLILSDGSEAVIHRKEKANILEQLNIIKFCSKQQADVLILECMALQPQYQYITEHQMVRATLGVITNIRLDHLDVMGPTLEDVGRAICGTIPRNSKLFTSEDRFLGMMQKVGKRRKTEVFQSTKDSISDADMKDFNYIEHKDNVALALDVCQSFGIDRDLALAEMKNSIPDEGVLQRHSIREDSKRINFYNAFAANDPESSLMIWNSIKAFNEEDEHLMVLLNTRKDRQDRARQLVKLIKDLDYNTVALMGESMDLVVEMCLKNSIPRDKIVSLDASDPEEQYNQLLKASAGNTSIVGIGNMGAGGAELSNYFEDRSKNLKKQLS